ncbi:hypothetical protein B4U80_10974 [Leptotrombidium deliense]|uniref:Endonuclease V-like protein n=1 Tax=Leptotrombidium deliense TaxID=299467 RepID=A0A443S4N8_9ACAR|nr:hypothetical protein B4U80_10974 [Leptotrombidium deliense]
MSEQQTELWLKEQDRLREQIILEDAAGGQEFFRLIAGLDISYSKYDFSKAVVTLVVLDSDLNIVYSHSSKLNDIVVPYIPGFLAFREVAPLLNEITFLQKSNPELMPDVVLIDGNGILHKNGFGLASHFGVCSDMVTIGVAKNPYIFENVSDSKRRSKESYKCSSETLKLVGDYFEIKHPLTDKVVGVGIKTTVEAKKPVYVSVGHKCSLSTAISVTVKCCKYRVPEPLRLADKISRHELSKF